MSKNDEIPEWRKKLYKIGLWVILLGIVLIFSVVVTSALNFGNFDNFSARVRGETLRSVGGFFLTVSGVVLCLIGRHGLAGAGIILDTKKEQKDTEPVNRMRGRQFNDFLEEANLASHLGQQAAPIVKIRCQACRHLNEEEDNFCGGCGKPI